MRESENSSVSTGISRRSVLKAAAWSVPAIAVASATPALASSLEPTNCVFDRGAPWVASGMLASNGGIGSSPTTNGLFGTGWLPAAVPEFNEDWQNPIYTQNDGAVAPEPVTWWQGGGEVNELGFMSLDDRNNSQVGEGDDLTPAVVTSSFQIQGVAGVTYQVALPVYTAASYLGPQFLKVEVSGVGVPLAEVGRGYVGTKSLTPTGAIPSELDGYPQLASSQNFFAEITPTTDGPIVFNYTFTLVAVSAAPRQNADIVVQAPTVSNCAA